MLACDFILGSFDRHYNDFGLIRDARLLEFVGPAPIYDSGNGRAIVFANPRAYQQGREAGQGERCSH